MKIKPYLILYSVSCILYSLLLVGCEREKPEVTIKEEEEQFLKEELPPLEEWAKREWEAEKEEMPLETEKGLQEAMAATSLNMRRLDRSEEHTSELQSQS